jgi:membrane associated rhomboid family serine protease
MGIYDREYYRGETRGSGWFSTSPVCRAIITINVAVFVLEHLNVLPEPLVWKWLAATSDGIFKQGRVWELLTATFIHFDLIHLIVNMYFFWVFGHEIEAMYGPRDFLALYLSAAVFSTLGWAVVDASSPGQHVPMIGASGAVFAVTALYALFYPRRELLFMFVIPLEVWMLVGLLIAFDAYVLLSGRETTTAVAAHLAGAGYGYLYRRFDLRWSRLPWGRGRRPRLRIVSADPPREKPANRPSAGATWSPNTASASKPASSAVVVSEEQLDARLDEVLAKIAREGRAGLTEEENRILQEASRRARNRRSDRL